MNLTIFRSLQPPSQNYLPYKECLYLVKNEETNTFETYVVDAFGTILTGFSEAKFLEALDFYSHSLNQFEIVNNLLERDALPKSKNFIVFVLDATDDPEVGSGSALYFYMKPVDRFIKIYQSTEKVITVQWSNIIGGPRSTPEMIDSAVSLAHQHPNKNTLDLITDNGGFVHYNGRPVTQFLVGSSEW